MQDEIQRKAERKSKALKERDSVKVGDIFCYSWGWEQTNVDMYEVIEKKSKASIVVRPIATETVQSTSWASENCRAVPGHFIGEPETVRLNGASFKRSSGSANKMQDPKKSVYRSWYA
jgi:hypothetical protein